ncbi:hypothetical protein ACHAXA_000497 [Cyclostephanos tholiformis]|uniref:Uncharacterized protein n=1 Tax=Cyclostephanos tholiformis TaxID=382380 RepID=A0ABD3SSN4_9STRA
MHEIFLRTMELVTSAIDERWEKIVKSINDTANNPTANQITPQIPHPLSIASTLTKTNIGPKTMASRTVVLLLLLSAIGADVLAANLPSLTSRHLRNDPFQATVDDESGGTSVDNPELDIPELAESRRSLQDIVISSQCLNTLAASSDKNGNLGPENFYVFTDGMSNGYFSTNNMKDYGSLPMQNKFAFVTLSCQCQLMGLRDNCCQGLRARIRVAGIDPENPESMNEQLQQYVSDICSTTLDAIGEENILPPLAELADDPTSPPSLAPLPAIEAAPGVGEIDADAAGGLSGGAIAGIVLASAAVTTLLLYIMAPKKWRDEEKNEDDDLVQMDQTNTEKEMAAINPDERPDQESSDSSTAGMTISDSGSFSTKGSSKTAEMSNYYAKNNLLPTHPDEESLSTNDQPHHFASDESVEMNSDASDIANGNWEQVAASASAYVDKNDPMHSTKTSPSARSGWEV